MFGYGNRARRRPQTRWERRREPEGGARVYTRGRTLSVSGARRGSRSRTPRGARSSVNRWLHLENQQINRVFLTGSAVR